MARVSKQNLTLQQAQDLSDQLAEVIGRMDSKLAQHFLGQFFGKEEKEMLAKRLAIIALIQQGRPIHRIATYLYVANLQWPSYTNGTKGMNFALLLRC